MRSLAMSAGLEKEIIWLIRITDGTNTLRLATPVSHTLDGNVWDGDSLAKTDNRMSINEVGKRINIEGGGVSGEVSTVVFALKKGSTNPLLDGYINEFYPASGGRVLVTTNVEVGIIWSGATAESEITWLQKYNVDNYGPYDQSVLNLICSEFSENENFMIPYYKVQDETDNQMSYFPQAPEDNFGVVLPIVYGSFTRGFDVGVDMTFWQLSPSVLVNKYSMQVFVASHQVKTTSVGISVADEYNVYRYIDSAKTYMVCFKNDNTDGYNQAHRYYIYMTSGAGDVLLGNLSLLLREISPGSNVILIENISDDDLTSYDELDANAGGDEQIVMNAGINLSTSDVGYCGAASGDVQITFKLSSDGVDTRNFNISYFNNTLPTPVEATGTNGSVTGITTINKHHSFGTSTSGKKDSVLPWTVEEVLALDFRVMNTETSAGDKIFVYRATINFYNMRVNGLFRGRRSRYRLLGRNEGWGG